MLINYFFKLKKIFAIPGIVNSYFSCFLGEGVAA